MYVAFDPGGKYTGWATFEKDGTDKSTGVIEGKQSVYHLLKYIGMEATKFIIEEFTLYPWKSEEQKWSQFGEVRVIGALEYFAYANNIPVVYQKATIKDIGYMWAGLKNRHKHDEDAYVHGLYYLIRNKIRSPTL